MCAWPIKHQLLLLKTVMKCSWQVAATKSEEEQPELMNPQQSAWLSICFHNPHKRGAHSHAHKHAWRVWLSVYVYDCMFMCRIECCAEGRGGAFIYYHVFYLGSPANLSGATERGECEVSCWAHLVTSGEEEAWNTYPLTHLMPVRAQTLKSNLNYKQVHLPHWMGAFVASHMLLVWKQILTVPPGPGSDVTWRPAQQMPWNRNNRDKVFSNEGDLTFTPAENGVIPE